MQLHELTFCRFYFFIQRTKNGLIFILEIGVEFEGIVVHFFLVIVRTIWLSGVKPLKHASLRRFFQ